MLFQLAEASGPPFMILEYTLGYDNNILRLQKQVLCRVAVHDRLDVNPDG